MKSLTISSVPSRSHYRELAKIWDKERHISLSLEPNLSEVQLSAIADLAIASPKLELSRVLLGELAEHQNCAIELLTRLFDANDPAVRVAIALRRDIPESLLEKILDCNDECVIEHVVFNPKVRITDCERLLKRARSPSVVQAIQRALQSKTSE